MEQTTEFNLELAVQEWRLVLAESPAVRRGDLDELESHLRDSVATLQAVGLSSREAFWVARTRLGPLDALAGEYVKVNHELVWLDRVLWMVGGWLAIGSVSGFISGLVTCVGVGLYGITQQLTLVGPVTLGLHFGGLLGLYFYLWQNGKHSDGVLWQTGRWAKNHPVISPLLLLLLTLLLSASSVGTTVLASKVLPMSAYASMMLWRLPAGMVSAVIWPVVLGWLLMQRIRKRTIS
jgi:hypothetical protein